MRKSVRYFFLYLLLLGCVDPYEFVIRDNEPTLVVEAYLSDKSFNETLTYPSDGRYFTVKLSYTSDVTNTRGEAIENATVVLINDLDEQWVYTHPDPEGGTYVLPDKEFKAEKGVKYKLRITLPDDDVYESAWAELPATKIPPMGDIGFRESQIKKYEYEAGEKVVKTVKVMNANIDLPAHGTGEQLYYRWDFTPMWIYVAPMASTLSPERKCWVTNPFYLHDYTLRADHSGGYKQDLFIMETERNERIYTEFTVLVRQEVMSEGHYYFWKEMQEQANSGGLFSTPPYTLQTNIHAINGDKRISGYFGVVSEQAKRWYFNREDLSYYVEDTIMADCSVDYGPPVRGEVTGCEDCRYYGNGEATNVMPAWWGR